MFVPTTTITTYCSKVNNDEDVSDVSIGAIIVIEGNLHIFSLIDSLPNNINLMCLIGIETGNRWSDAVELYHHDSYSIEIIRKMIGNFDFHVIKKAHIMFE